MSNRSIRHQLHHTVLALEIEYIRHPYRCSKCPSCSIWEDIWTQVSKMPFNALRRWYSGSSCGSTREQILWGGSHLLCPMSLIPKYMPEFIANTIRILSRIWAGNLPRWQPTKSFLSYVGLASVVFCSNIYSQSKQTGTSNSTPPCGFCYPPHPYWKTFVDLYNQWSLHEGSCCCDACLPLKSKFAVCTDQCLLNDTYFSGIWRVKTNTHFCLYLRLRVIRSPARISPLRQENERPLSFMTLRTTLCRTWNAISHLHF